MWVFVETSSMSLVRFTDKATYLLQVWEWGGFYVLKLLIGEMEAVNFPRLKNKLIGVFTSGYDCH